ncbi:hypothetical protein ABTE60_19665, partial [Acinetobacter baumannii]
MNKNSVRGLCTGATFLILATPGMALAEQRLCVYDLLGSAGDGLDSALGVWADYAHRRGRFGHNAGLFR